MPIIKPNGFEPSRNLAGFAANPGTYTATTGVTINKGALVKLVSGLVTNAAVADTSILGVAAEQITSATAGQKIRVYDNPLQVYKVGYTGTATPVAGGEASIAASGKEINSDDTTGGKPCVVTSVDSVNKILNVVIKKHALK